MEERQRQEQIEMLIRFYNMQAGTSFRVGKPENRSAVNSAKAKRNVSVFTTTLWGTLRLCRLR